MNRWKAGESGDPPANGEADDSAVGVPDIEGWQWHVWNDCWQRGLSQVMVAARGEKVDEMIQGDLVGSRVVLAFDAWPAGAGGWWSMMARSAVRWGSGRRCHNPCGKGRPMLSEESDGS